MKESLCIVHSSSSGHSCPLVFSHIDMLEFGRVFKQGEQLLFSVVTATNMAVQGVHKRLSTVQANLIWVHRAIIPHQVKATDTLLLPCKEERKFTDRGVFSSSSVTPYMGYKHFYYSLYLLIHREAKSTVFREPLQLSENSVPIAITHVLQLQ